jgi:O-methyltransferase
MVTDSPPRPRLSARKLVVKSLRALKLNRIVAAVYYKHVHGFASAGEELPAIVRRSLQQARDQSVPGDYYEFGVFKGHTFLHAQLAARDMGMQQMRFFGFDSFAGLPAPKGIDVTAEGHFYEGQFAWPVERVKSALSEGGVDWSRTFLIEGFFNETLNEVTRARFGMDKASVVLLDSDLYESARLALDFVDPLLSNGSILIMDDWNAFDADEARGERLALQEFLRSHPNWHAQPWFQYGNYGQVFTMRLKERISGLAGTLAMLVQNVEFFFA